VRELADMIPSNQAVPPRNFLNNVKAGKYPAELQPRDYDNKPGEQNKVWNHAHAMETRYYLSNHPDATNGPPTVTEGNIGINGTGRLMSLQASTHVGTYPKYRAALLDAADQFGIDRATVQGMKQPVLVRVVGMDPRSPEAKAFARVGNHPPTQAQSPTRIAAGLSEDILTDETIRALRMGGEETFSTMVSDRSKGRAFREKMYERMPDTMRDQYFDADQMLTEAGKELVTNMMVLKLLPVRLVEELSAERKQMLRSVEAAVPQLLKLRADKGEFDVTPALKKALQVLADDPSLKTPADAQDYFDQFTMNFENPEGAAQRRAVDPATRMMIDFLLTKGNSSKEFRKGLVSLASGSRASKGLLGMLQASDSAFDPAENAAAHLGVKRRAGARFGPEKGDTQPLGVEPDVLGGELPAPPDRGGPQAGGIPRRPGEQTPAGVNLIGSLGRTRPEPKEYALGKETVDATRRAEDFLRPIDQPARKIAAAARKENQVAWDEALARHAQNPRAVLDLMDELARESRPITSTEGALLLQRRIALSNELRRPRALIDPAADERERNLWAEVDRVDETVRRAGTELGRGLAFFRQLAADDYSLTSLTRRATAARKKPLTPEEQEKVAAVAAEVDATTKAAEGEGAPAGEKGDKLDLEIAADKAKLKARFIINEFTEAAKPVHHRIMGRVFDLFGLGRALVTGFDLPPLFRQGATATFGRTRQSLTAFREGLKAIRSERDFDRAQKELMARPNGVLYEQSGLALLDTHTRPDETFLSRLMADLPAHAGRVPLVGGLLKPAAHALQATQRGYTAYLNRLRADLFDLYLPQVMTANKGTSTGAELTHIANGVNVMTGYSKLPGGLERGAATLAQVLFSPRYLTSRFKLLAGQPVLGAPSAATRQLFAREYARALAGVGAMYALLSLQDEAKVTFDPRSTDFGKIKIGNTRLDPLAGLAQLTVFGSKVTTGEEVKPSTGHVVDLRGPKRAYGSGGVGDVMLRFGRTKLAPVPGGVIDRAVGTTVGGDPVTTPLQLRGFAVPMSVQDVIDALEDQGASRGTALSLLALVGMGTQTYAAGEKKQPPGTVRERLERVGRQIGLR
jgi:hypothetical protein